MNIFSGKAKSEKSHITKTTTPVLRTPPDQKENQSDHMETAVNKSPSIPQGRVKPMTVNIIGRGMGSARGIQADGEKWCINLPRKGADVFFDLHDFAGELLDPAMVSVRDVQLERRKQAAGMGMEVMTLDDYPIDAVIQHFGVDFFSNSIAYLIALAIYQRYTTINLHGCHINPTPGETEPIAKNHYGIEYWIGQAHGRGVEVKVHGDSLILKSPRYGRIARKTALKT